MPKDVTPHDPRTPSSVAAAASAGKCPKCGASANGSFCSSCGAVLASTTCAGCQTQLSSGARFCHRCGTPAGASPAPGMRIATSTAAPATARDPLPWAVAAIALVALIALIAGQKFGQNRGAATQSAPVAAPGGPVRAPDISNMTPREITTRLFDRVMAAHEQGLQDSAQQIALMAIPAFDLHDSLDADLRYDLGRIAEVTGVLNLAKAQADTILQQQPNHLLGLILSARVARLTGDTAAAINFDKRLLSAESAERARNLAEYQLHKLDVDSAVARARRGGEKN